MPNPQKIISFLPGFLLFILAGICQGQQFRSETDVYISSQSKPVSHHITLFDESKIYDLSYTAPPGGNPNAPFTEAVILDQKRKTITLINPKKKISFQISNSKLAELVSAMKVDEFFTKSDPFVINPTFEEEVNSETNSILLKSDRMNYRCKGRKESEPKVLAAYYYYIRWSASLNVTKPGMVPPFGRLKLNQFLEKNAWLPTETHFHFKPKKESAYNAKAKHHYTKLLSKIDRQRIESVKKIAATCRKVKIKEYRNLDIPSE